MTIICRFIEMLACKLFGDTKNGYVSAYKYDFSPPKAANTGACGTLKSCYSGIYSKAIVSIL